jgi:hypothetical protein
LIAAHSDRAQQPAQDTRAAARATMALLLLLVPFVWTGHVQEDAYITFRCAKNLAETGVYGFNAGERVSAATSHLSVFIAALARLVFGAAFIPIVQLLYGAAAIAGIHLLATSLVADARAAFRAWIVVASLPVSLMAAYSGMETGLLVLLTGLALNAVTFERWTWSGAMAFALLPWARPDAIAIGLIVLFAVGAVERRFRPAAMGFASLAAGAITWGAFNRIYFGTWLTQTIAGKAAVWLPDSLSNAVRWGVARERLLMLGGDGIPGLFAPIATKYLAAFSAPCALLVAGACAATIVRPSRFGVRRGPATALALIAFALPAAYAFGGVVHPWYLWPSAMAGWLAVFAIVAGWVRRHAGRAEHVAALATATVLAVFAAGQFAFASVWATEERLYRGGIGEHIRSIAGPHDTLLLEPAGYIPFYAGVTTWDEIGLASPDVTRYRQSYGARWWIRFVTDRHPTFLVEREHIIEHRTLDGYMLSPDEQHWFDRHYVLVREFHYDPDALRASRLLARLARLGSARTYRLYKFSV